MDRNFSVMITKKTEKKLNKKFKPYKDQIIDAMLNLEVNPILSDNNMQIEKLKGFPGEYYRFKVSLPDGSCRCVYELNRDKKECLIFEFDFRENIDYRKLQQDL